MSYLPYRAPNRCEETLGYFGPVLCSASSVSEISPVSAQHHVCVISLPCGDSHQHRHPMAPLLPSIPEATLGCCGPAGHPHHVLEDVMLLSPSDLHLAVLCTPGSSPLRAGYSHW